ncbi:unnamed protein product [Leuciscus chuanchicus]
MPPKNAKTSPCEEDAVVKMSVLSQLMEQQRGIYKDMLLQQQDNFKCFIQLIMDGTNKRLDGVIRDVQELKTSLEFTQTKFEEEKMGCTEIEAKIRAFETNITTSKQELDAMFNKLDYIENQSRRTNILIDGIADEKGENWCESEKKVREMFSKNLGLDGINMDIERAQRLGSIKINSPTSIKAAEDEHSFGPREEPDPQSFSGDSVEQISSASCDTTMKRTIKKTYPGN